MFLTRSLERLHDVPCLFGMAGVSQGAVAQALDGPPDDMVAAALHPSSPGVEVIARRYAQMVSRNRSGALPEKYILSDHGLKSFPGFLFKPSDEDIVEPGDIVNFATRNNLRVVFLHRDIRHVGASLAHFLTAGKSFLVKTDDFSATCDLVAQRYAPVLKLLTRRWLEAAEHMDITCVSYEQLMQAPVHHLSRIAQDAGFDVIAGQDDETLKGYKSWTYREKRSDWHEGFPQDAKDRLEALATDAAVMDAAQ